MSRQEAKRLIKQGAVEINGKKETRMLIPASEIPDGSIIRVGKHRICRIRWFSISGEGFSGWAGRDE